MDMIQIRLKEIAESRNKNMSQVQRSTGLTMGMVRRYWNNDTGAIRLDALEKLCRLFDVPVGEMMVIVEPPPNPFARNHAAPAPPAGEVSGE